MIAWPIRVCRYLVVKGAIAAACSDARTILIDLPGGQCPTGAMYTAYSQ
jgi:hypothetical protein